MSNQLRKKLKEIRETRGLGTIEQTAELMGASRRTVGDYERGHRLPDLDYLARFADKSGTDLRTLIDLRLAAGGHDSEMKVRDHPPDGGYKVPDSLGPTRTRLAMSIMPPEWQTFLIELVLRGKMTTAAAEDIAAFFDDWQPTEQWLRYMEKD